MSISRARGYLGLVHGELGNYEEAKILLKKSYKIYAQHYGVKHAASAYLLRSLGKVYLLEGNIKEAEKVIKSALEAFSESDHPGAYIALEDLADLNLRKDFELKKRNKNQQDQQLKILACEYLNRALYFVKSYFPDDSPHIPRIQSKINDISE